MDSITSRNVTARGVPLSRQSIAHIGRPIAQVSNIHDPLEEAEAARIQFEAKAAVDIQRIFRGYVARNVYKKLLKEERERREDEQKAAVEIQRRYRGHLTRKTKIEKKTGLSPELLQWAKDFKEVQMENALERHKKMTVLSQTIYHPKQTGPTKEELTLAAIQIQKHIRGFIIRKRFEKLERKAVWHGSTFSKMVRDYKNMLRKCQLRHGVDRPKTPFTIHDFNEYLDMRKRYESVFDKKSFGNELELIELEAFFRESDLYPSASEIDEAMDVVLHGHDVKRGLLKNEVLEMVFYIYVPKATGLPMTRQSTWLNPIIDGVEARKLIGSEFVEKAPLEVCAKLVIDSKRERRERENQEKERKLEEELAKNRKTPSSRGSNKTEL
ncbi:hypothetical protein FSP39_001865 [Pinctada imbricata]|uniref:Uncharacterized protein n=1 Tax=Pinctada imbricata TaxID=66713 RepID=A0AA88YLC2_PINIB|nr:hypothetical protein FSP39_001865 [Pinctada imbricata]